MGQEWSKVQSSSVWSVLVKFSSKGLKKRYFYWMNEGMHGLKTGATGHMELLEGCKWEKEDEKAVDWSLRVVLWGSDEGSRCTYYSFPIFLSICQWARKPKGADTVEKSLQWSQRQSLLMKLFLTGIQIQEAVTGYLLADFCFRSPQCCPGNLTYLKWKAQRAAAVGIRLWALTPSWAHLRSCRMFTSMVVLGDLFWFFEGPVW